LMFPHTLPAYPNRVEIAPGRLSIWLDDGPQAIGKMLDKIHEHGSAMFAQIGYAGRQFSTAAGQRPVFAPSPIPWHPGGEVPREMTASDIARFVKAFANTAERVRECGFDGVEIHGAHGYFLHEFLSPLSNHRTDDYGGSLENRARIVLEVLRAVRDAVGTDYVVGIRLSGAEFVEGGLTLDEQVKVAASLKSTGELDYVNVSAGAYASMERIVPPMYMPQGVHVHLAKAIKEAVGDTPVIATGRIYEPQFAEQVLSEGAADMVGMLRAMIADPVCRKAA
jgi:2,4-dienoyl-CoA reductase-like NADH-dependent reductase (Old Yellow Enzyme family)